MCGGDCGAAGGGGCAAAAGGAGSDVSVWVWVVISVVVWVSLSDIERVCQRLRGWVRLREVGWVLWDSGRSKGSIIS